MTFIGYTCGLECNGNGKVAKLLKVEYARESNGVKLTAVSGHNLSSAGVSRIITEEAFENRPRDQYDSTKEAIWALGVLGFNPMSID